MVEYEHADLRGSRFDDVDLRDSELRASTSRTSS